MNIIVFVVIVAAMVAIRFLKPNALVWMAAWWGAIYVAFRFGFDPPLPSSIVFMFMFIVTIAILAFMSADSGRMKEVGNVVVKFMVDRAYRIPLLIALIGLPVLVAWKVYSDSTGRPSPPISGRTIHPVPPAEITFKGKKINLVTDDNPFRELEKSDPDAFAGHVIEGRRVYFQNCVFCHGDDMTGDGIFAHGFDPIPANFQDPTTIAMLQEGYLFWRIAKGGPGLPEESTPWASAMPAWENFLTEDQIWDVILFLYDHTGHRPRSREEVEE